MAAGFEHIRLVPDTEAAIARLRSLLIALASSGDVGEILGELLRESIALAVAPWTLILSGWFKVLISMGTLGRGVKHCVHLVAFGQFR